MKKYIVGAVIVGLAGLVSLAFAEDNKPEVSHVPIVSRTPKPEVTPTVEARTCMQNAVNKRDLAIISAFEKFSSSVKSALSTRKDALKAAWDKTTKAEIRLALRSAGDVYDKSVRDARKALNADKKVAWSQYKTDSKVCKPVIRDRSEGTNEEGSDIKL